MQPRRSNLNEPAVLHWQTLDREQRAGWLRQHLIPEIMRKAELAQELDIGDHRYEAFDWTRKWAPELTRALRKGDWNTCSNLFIAMRAAVYDVASRCDLHHRMPPDMKQLIAWTDQWHNLRLMIKNEFMPQYFSEHACDEFWDRHQRRECRLERRRLSQGLTPASQKPLRGLRL